MDNINNVEPTATEDLIVEEVVAVSEPVVPEIIEPVIQETQPEPVVVKPKSAKKIDSNDVALYSSKNFVGISKGYSSVDKSLANELLKNPNIRLATETEINEHLNK